MVRDKHRILFVTAYLGVGGTEHHLLWLLTELRERGYDARIFVLMPGGSLTENFRDAGIPVFESPQRNDDLLGLIKASVALSTHMLANTYDVVHYFLPAAYIIGSACTIFTSRAKRVMSRRSLNRYQLQRPALHRLEHLLHHFTHRIVANSEAVLRDLRSEGVRESQLALIHNGVAIPTALNPAERVEVRRQWQVADDALLLVSVANLFAYKGHMELLEALALVKERLPVGSKMIFIGRDSGEGERLRNKSRQLGLENLVLWTGAIGNPTPIQQAADIALQCSHEEGFSNAVLEAMAAGVPLLATDTGGNPDAVIDGSTGLLVPVADSQAIADALLRLAESPELRRQLGTAARVRVIDTFSQIRCIEKYEDLYRELLAH